MTSRLEYKEAKGTKQRLAESSFNKGCRLKEVQETSHCINKETLRRKQ